MKRILCAALAALLCISLMLPPFPVQAADNAAENITASTAFSGSGFSDFSFLKDSDIDSFRSSAGNAAITLKNDAGIGGLYLIFDLEYGQYTIRDNTTGVACAAGKDAFLHEFVNLEEAFGGTVTDITLEFSKGAVRLSEISVYTSGSAPDTVQSWDKPLDGNADLVLFATHGDDDQLFFAGLLPYYAKAMGYRVQVVYLTDHRNLTNARVHEMLNGLWAVGVTAYPVFGSFADFRIDDLDGTYAEYQNLGVSKDMLQKFVVEQLRRFKPLVAVGHDLKGEYGHGMHMVYADLLTKGLTLANDPAVYPDLTDKYGTWDVPKTYLHLYDQNKVVLDIDLELEALDGMTAFQVTQKFGYPCHKSQQYTWFTGWLNGKNGNVITQSSQIATYNPAQYGLYRSTVGEDTIKNGLFENLKTRGEQERLEQEKLEQERLEQERLEQERLEQLRQEQERLEQELLEQEKLAKEQQETRELTGAVLLLAVLILSLLVVLYYMHAARKRSKNTGKKK